MRLHCLHTACATCSMHSSAQTVLVDWKNVIVYNIDIDNLLYVTVTLPDASAVFWVYLSPQAKSGANWTLL